MEGVNLTPMIRTSASAQSIRQKKQGLTPMIRTSASAQSIRQKKQGLTPMIRTFVFVQSIHQRKMYHLLQKNDSCFSNSMLYLISYII